MANVPHNKKGLSFVKKAQQTNATMQGVNDDWQDLKTKFQAANIDINTEGFPLTAQQVSDTNAMITAFNVLMNDYSATIDVLNNINVGSHEGHALD